MKRICVALILVITLCVSLAYFSVSVCKSIINKTNSKEDLKLAYEIVGNTVVNNEKNILVNENTNELVNLNKLSNVVEERTEELKIEGDIIGIIRIPAINIEAPIKEGTSQEIMHTSVGHFVESDFWNGNVSLASHNSGISAHYFENINKLNYGDEIEYITKLGIKKYKVESISKIKSTDWSMVYGNNSGVNTITLITCISFKPDYRLCIRAIEQ